MTLPTTHTLEEVAASLRVSARTVLRAIERSGVALPKIGSRLRLTDKDVEQLMESLRCRSRSHESGAASGMQAARSGSGKRSRASRNTPQAALSEHLRTTLQRAATPKSAAKSLKVLPGGRGP